MVGYHYHGTLYARMIENDLAMGTTDYLTTTPFFLIRNSNTVRCRSFSGLVHFFTLNSYIASSLVFAFIGFLGQYHLYRTFASAYPSPRLRIWWRAGLLYMPSITFWTAGLLKDPLGLWGLGSTVWGGFSLFQRNRYSGVLRLALGVYVLLLFRAQAAPVLMLALVPLMFSTRLAPGAARMSKGAWAAQMAVRLGCLFAFAAVCVYSTSSEKRADYTNLQSSLINERNNYTKVSGGSTVTDRVESAPESSALGLLRLWPESMVLCLFRPFLWESFRCPIMIIAGLENTVLLLLTLRAAFFAFIGPRSLVAALRSPLFLMCLIFVGVFGFAIGVSTPNLGTNSRYRIPAIPFFIGALGILESQRLERKAQRKFPVANTWSTFPRVEARRPAPPGSPSGSRAGE